MQRRDFLKKTGAGVLGASAGLGVSQNAGAGEEAGQSPFSKLLADKGALSNPVLVVIFLRGGQDQLNTIVPYTDPTYYRIRPTIAIPKEDVVKLNGRWGLHPGMQTLKKPYDQGRLAFVINSGSHHPTRSHFDAQDFMEYAAPGERIMRDGWLNRYLEATANPRGDDPEKLRAISMQERCSRSLRGSYPVIAVPPNLRDIEQTLGVFEPFYAGGDDKALADLFTRAKKSSTGSETRRSLRPSQRKRSKEPTGLGVDPVMASGMQTIKGLRTLRNLLYGDRAGMYDSSREDYESQTFQEYPHSWFATRLQQLAKVIKADEGLEVATTDINGWDHHIGLGGLNGGLNRMATFLSEGLGAFMDDLGPHLDRTLVMVCTEFGRVAKENGNDGSDHGHGGAMWLMGGAVRGGRVYGRWTGLEESALYQKRDQPVTTDFRDIFAEVLRKHMKFDFKPDFFPKFTPAENGLGLLG